MTATSKYRGNEIYYDERSGKYRYVSDDALVEDEPSRPCGRCKCRARDNGDDACLGYLPGVVNACCGHGEDGYIEFINGVRIEFKDSHVIRIINESKEQVDDRLENAGVCERDN